jgi:hypothetical protein
MPPRTEPGGFLADAAAADEGADYARALLERIGAGVSSPDDLAAVMQLLHSGTMLHGACVVIFEALRTALAARSAA